jgi:hypothetical protein
MAQAMHCNALPMCILCMQSISRPDTHTSRPDTHTSRPDTHTQADTQTGEACNYVYVCKQACKHTGTTCKCIWAAILISKGFFKVSLPNQQQIHGSKLSRSTLAKPKTGEPMVGPVFGSPAGVGYARRRITQTSMCILQGGRLQQNLHMRSTLTSVSGCLKNLMLGQWPTLMGLALVSI